MKRVFFIPLLFILTLSSTLKAQSDLGIDSNFFSYSIPTSTSFNNNDNYIVSVKNFGPQTYTGTVIVEFYLDSSTVGSSFVKLDSSIINNTVISPNSGVSDSALIHIDSTKFRSGINTVVIWPKTSSATTHDSLKINILVVGYAGINGPINTNKTIIFPVPMQNKLFVANKDQNFIIEQVRIFDLSGRLIQDEKFNGSLDVSKLTSGVYTLEFSDKNGKTSRYKVIKE